MEDACVLEVWMGHGDGGGKGLWIGHSWAGYVI